MILSYPSPEEIKTAFVKALDASSRDSRIFIPSEIENYFAGLFLSQITFPKDKSLQERLAGIPSTRHQPAEASCHLRDLADFIVYHGFIAGVPTRRTDHMPFKNRFFLELARGFYDDAGHIGRQANIPNAAVLIVIADQLPKYTPALQNATSYLRSAA